MPVFEDPFEGLRRLRAIRDAQTEGYGGSDLRLPEVSAQRRSGGVVASGGVPQGGGGYGGGDPKSRARAAAAQQGWTGAEWDSFDRLIQKESSWNPTAKNPTSTAWGLFQFLDMHYGPGRYLPKGRNSNVDEQIAGGIRYIRDRYGSPSRALAFHRRNNWY